MAESPAPGVGVPLAPSPRPLSRGGEGRGPALWACPAAPPRRRRLARARAEGAVARGAEGEGAALGAEREGAALPGEPAIRGRSVGGNSPPERRGTKRREAPSSLLPIPPGAGLGRMCRG